MGFVSDYKYMPKSISHSGEILGKSSRRTYGKSFTTGTDSKGGASDPRSLTLKIW